MPTYMIEREIPGASKLTDEELRGITTTSNDAVDGLERPYTWLHSYVAGDKIYCVHDAETPRTCSSTRARRLSRRPRRGGHGGVRQHRPARAAGLTPDCRWSRLAP